MRAGPPETEIARLARESGAESVVAARDFSPYARRRDEAIARHVRLELTGGTTIRGPSEVLKGNGEPFRVFTPYSRAWLREPPHRDDLLDTPERLPAVPDAIESLPLPEATASDAFPPGETEALRRLDAFTASPDAPLSGYAEDRNRLDLDGTSTLSPYLRFGMLSPRLAAVTAQEATESAQDSEARKGAQTWLNELIWRDFYIAVLHHFPDVLRQDFDPAFRHMQWRNDPAEIEAWQEARTGYPVVDAAMRQLAATGWVHNRARMIVASFLVKHLLVDWRIGEAWFMRHLVDGDPAANNGGWQWTAGVGTDAAPYFRVFNPVLQARRFDPEGAYVRRWLPELANVPNRFVHEPWRMPLPLQDDLGIRIGADYPAPIVDLGEGRERAIAAYKAAREAASR